MPAIVSWESELLEYESATDDLMGPENKKMCVEDICPLELQNHLAEESHRLKNYTQLKQEITDYINNDKRWKKGGSIKCVRDHHEDQQESSGQASADSLCCWSRQSTEQLCWAPNARARKSTPFGR